MAGYIEDKWLNKKPDPKTGKRKRTALWGKGKRYRVKGIPGMADASFHRSDDAKAWLNKHSDGARKGETFDPRAGDMTLADYVNEHWWPHHPARGTYRASLEERIVHLLLLGKYPLNSIGHERLKEWVAKLRKNLSASTQEQAWGVLSMVFASAVKAGRLAKNPCRDNLELRPSPKGERLARAWPRDVAFSVRDSAPPRYQLLPDLGLGCGLRQGEALGVAVEDITGSELHVQRQIIIIKGKMYFKLPKGDKTRKIPIPAALKKRIDAHVKAFPPVKVTLPWLDLDAPDEQADEPRLVTAELLTTTQPPHSNPPNRHYFNAHIWKPTLGRAGLISQVERKKPRKTPPNRKAPPLWEPSRELGFHTCRHTYASTLLEAGENPVTVSKWLGHANTAITLKYYAHFMPGAGTRGIAALDAWYDGPQENCP